MEFEGDAGVADVSDYGVEYTFANFLDLLHFSAITSCSSEYPLDLNADQEAPQGVRRNQRSRVRCLLERTEMRFPTNEAGNGESSFNHSISVLS